MGIDYVVSILTDVIADIQSGGTSVMKFDLNGIAGDVAQTSSGSAYRIGRDTVEISIVYQRDPNIDDWRCNETEKDDESEQVG